MRPYKAPYQAEHRAACAAGEAENWSDYRNSHPGRCGNFL